MTYRSCSTSLTSLPVRTINYAKVGMFLTGPSFRPELPRVPEEHQHVRALQQRLDQGEDLHLAAKASVKMKLDTEMQPCHERSSSWRRQYNQLLYTRTAT